MPRNDGRGEVPAEGLERGTRAAYNGRQLAERRQRRHRMQALHAIDADGHVSEDRVDWAARIPSSFGIGRPATLRTSTGGGSSSSTATAFRTRCTRARDAGRRCSSRGVAGQPAGMRDPVGPPAGHGHRGDRPGGALRHESPSSPPPRRLALLGGVAGLERLDAGYCAAAPRASSSPRWRRSASRAAAEETERAVRELGAVGVTSRPTTRADRSIKRTSTRSTTRRSASTCRSACTRTTGQASTASHSVGTTTG